MKKFLLSFVFTILISWAFSAPFKFLPHQITQPDGTIIECFLSGDEYFNWIHDEAGFSIIQGNDGYYYYAVKEKNKIMASSHRVNSIDPEITGLKKWIKISKEEYAKKRDFYAIPSKNEVLNAPHTGPFNNIVIYIRFSGDSELSTTRQEYDDNLNSETQNSLKSYFTEVSYNQLTINSTHYPDCANPSTTNASYEDTHTRSYFQPYNATTNPEGYTDDQRTEREHQLLVDAVNWVNTNYAIDPSLNIDGDNDGYVDNVCFMIQGNSDGWAELLWAHRWSLYSKTVEINGKRVYDYTFQPENQVDVRVLCHEMFHALGAPDLYHYNENSLSPVSSWDLMESGYGHMGAYMKYKYADQKWITEIPAITTAGTYTLEPLTSSTNNCFKIASPNSSTEFFMLEYRKRSGDFESNLPGDGLLVYRINSNFNGNAQYDGSSVFDEVYIYRPNGTTTLNGMTSSANFSSDVSRTSINDQTNPSCFLSDGSVGGLNIFNIRTAGTTISFDVKIGSADNPGDFNATVSSSDQIDLSWQLNADNDQVLIAYSMDGTFGVPLDDSTYTPGNQIEGGGEVLYSGSNTSYNHQSLSSGQEYHYKIWSITAQLDYSLGATASAYIDCEASLLPLREDFSSGSLPSCWQNNDQVGNGQIWVFDNPAARSFNSTSNANGFAILDSDHYGSGFSQDAHLISPLLDLSIYASVNLQFEHYFRDYEGEYVELMYSIDAGQSWSSIQSWTLDEGTSSIPAVFNQDVSDLMAGQPAVKIKWRYAGSFGYYWILDDIEITGVSSGEPSVITTDADGISLTQATLHGSINANDHAISEIQFEYGTEPGIYTHTINATPTTAGGLTSTKISADLSGLSIHTNYYYRLTCKNGTELLRGGEISFVTDDYPDPVVITTDADGIETDLARLHGSVNANAHSITDIQFEYGIFRGNYTSTINAAPTTASGTSNTLVSAEISSLTSNTQYFYRLKCNKGAELFYGDEKAFTTEEFPIVSISSDEIDYTKLSPIEVKVTFSEELTSFVEADITLTNSSVTSLTKISSTEYDLEITPIDDGEVTLQLEENAVEDLAGFGNIGSSVFSIIYDSSLPEVVITSSESTSTRISPIELSFTFTEDVSDFMLSDITVDNGTSSNLNSLSAKSYTADITPANGGDLTVYVNADAVYDLAQNSNLVSDEWTIYYSSPTGINELSDAGIKLYPNPTNGLLAVVYERAFTKAEVKIFDLSGRLVYIQEMKQNMEQKIDLTGQPKGSYIIQFTIDQEQISTSLLVQ